uniref:Putative disease resistance gene NBS-LRR family protein n=1 Tax=Rhizophora mucronata TaxID=61149 RepID=A0A2P2KW84_RHIMU
MQTLEILSTDPTLYGPLPTHRPE